MTNAEEKKTRNSMTSAKVLSKKRNGCGERKKRKGGGDAALASNPRITQGKVNVFQTT